MVLRLSVALALCGSPSLVLIDDVLAVGDIGFQQRCIERVQALKEAGCTLLLALPDEAHIRQLATRVITLSDGRIVSDTSPVENTVPAVDGRVAEIEWRVSENLAENEVMALRAVDCQAAHDDEGSFLDIGATFEPRAGALRCRPLISVDSTRSELFRSVYPAFVTAEEGGTLTFTVRVPVSVLPDGEYTIGVHMAALRTPNVYALKANDAVHLTVRRQHPPDTRDVAVDSVQPQLMLPTQWEIEPVVEAPA
jgi:lipopolysaccharide transport system ATP-binding protein